MQGAGYLAIWSDLSPADETDWAHWITREHAAERVGIRGFLACRIFRALGTGANRYFILYELDDENVVGGDDYLARLNAPTAWTRSATSHFRNTSRALTRTVLDFGCGLGGVVGTIRFDGSTVGEERCRAAASSASDLSAAARLPRISRVRLFLTNLAASSERTAESRDRSDIRAAPSGAIMIEGCDEAAVNAAVNSLRLKPDAACAPGLYRLEHQLF